MVTPFNDLVGQKTTGGTWTKVFGPTVPEAPTEYDGEIDFTTALVGRHVYKYTVSENGCTDEAFVTYEHKKKLPMYNNECSSPAFIAVPFGNSFPFDTLNYTMLDEWTSCEPSPMESEYYCERSPATLSNQSWLDSSNVNCDSWYRIDIPQYATAVFGITVTVSSLSYPTGGLQFPKIALYGSSVLNDCNSLVLLNESTAVNNNTVSLTTYMGVTQYQSVYLRVGVRNLQGGWFSIQVQI